MYNNEDLTKSLVSRYFNRFELLITTGIIVLISVMILAAFWGLVVETYHLVHHGAFDKLDHRAFQAAFGMIMTLLIAIEFSYTIMNAYMGKSREMIVKNVVLVSMLAIARQFIVFEDGNHLAPDSVCAGCFAYVARYRLLADGPDVIVGCREIFRGLAVL